VSIAPGSPRVVPRRASLVPVVSIAVLALTVAALDLLLGSRGILTVGCLAAGLFDRLADGARWLGRWSGRLEGQAPDAPAPDLYGRGVEAERAGKIEAAARDFEEVLRRDPAHAGAHGRLADLAGRRGDTQAALTHALLALRAEDSAEAHLAAGDAYARADRIEDALQMFQQVLARDPEHAVALRRVRDTAMGHARWAEALAAQERLARLVGAAERAIERECLAGIHHEIGRSRLAGGDAAGAAGAFRDALRVLADFVPAHVGLGDAHQKAGEGAQALRAWERGLDAAPGALALLHRVEQVHRAEGRPRRMIALYERAVARCPDDLAVAVALGRVYFELSMLDEATDQFEKIEVRAPSLPALHGYLGRIFERRGLLRDACGEYRRGLDATGSLEWPHRCTACGATHAGWADRCLACRRWNTLRS
jgi:tetratricopeptide (TPR) repeat protein